MKLATYYKNKREIVQLSPLFCPEMYTKFIIRKDYFDNHFPEEYYKYKNVEYGGYGYTNGIYVPLDLKIESCYPDTSIYKKFEDNFIFNNLYAAAFKTMENSQHLRISLDGKTIWKDFYKQVNWTPATSTLFIHDRDLTQIENYQEAIKFLYKKNPRKDKVFFASKFPINVNSDEELLFLCGLPSSGNFFNVDQHGYIADETLAKIAQDKETSLAFKKINYFITDGCKTEQDFILLLPKIYKQILFLRMNRIKISLKYREDFFIHKEWERVILLMNRFLSHICQINKAQYQELIVKDTMFDFVSHFGKRKLFTKGEIERDLISIEEAREIFLFVKENSPETFSLFYDKSIVELKEGEFV